VRVFLPLFLLVQLLSRPACAAELERQASEILGTQAMEEGLLPEERDISGALDEGSYDAAGALKRLWRAFAGDLRQQARDSFAFAAGLLGLVFACSFALALCRDEKQRAVIDVCGACAAAGLLLGGVEGLVSDTTAAVFRLSDYSKAALPVVFTAAAAGGAVSSAAARCAAAELALDVMMSLSQKTVIPLVYAYLALALTGVVFPDPLLTAVEKLARWAAKTVMTGAVLAFTAYLGITTLITTAVDAAAVKTARTVISGALPVVGGMLADASAAVLSAANLVKSCAGAFGLVAVCAMCAGPFALLSVRTFVFKALAAAADSVQSARLQRLFAGVGGAVALLMGLLGSCAVMLFLSFTIAMKAVTGV